MHRTTKKRKDGAFNDLVKENFWMLEDTTLVV
jgi:hypothetical protein